MKNSLRNVRITQIIAGKLRRDPSGTLAYKFWDKLEISGGPWIKDGIWEDAEKLAFPPTKVHQWPYS